MTTNKLLTGAAVVALTAADHDFMVATYPSKAGGKWSADMGGNMPSKQNHMDASVFGVRLGSKQALALALTLRDGGSTASQRTYAGDGKTQNNIGGLQDILRQQHKTAKLVAGQTYKLTLANGAVFDVTSNKAGHVAAKLVTPPNAPAPVKVAAKVAAKADTAKAPATVAPAPAAVTKAK